MVILSSLDEGIVVGDVTYQLASHRYQGAVHPRGFGYIREFQVQPFPKTTFAVEGMVIEKEVFMLHGHNTTLINYCISNTGTPAVMRIFPLVNLRNIHSTTKGSNFDFNREVLDSGVVVGASGAYRRPGVWQNCCARMWRMCWNKGKVYISQIQSSIRSYISSLFQENDRREEIEYETKLFLFFLIL